MNQAPPKSKYRPYFTPSQLGEIIRCVKIASQDSALIRYLEIFSLKIDHGIQAPALNLAPTLGEKLELGLDEPSQSLETKRHNAYLTWLSYPNQCSPFEIELTHLYRFENDLMSPEEETIYLESQGVPAK